MKQRHGQEERASQQTYARQRARRQRVADGRQAGHYARRRRRRRRRRPAAAAPRDCQWARSHQVPTRPPRAQRPLSGCTARCTRARTPCAVHRITMHRLTSHDSLDSRSNDDDGFCFPLRTAGHAAGPERVPFPVLHLTHAAVAARRPPHGVHGRTRGASRFSRWGLAALCGWSKSTSGRNGRAMRRRQ